MSSTRNDGLNLVVAAAIVCALSALFVFWCRPPAPGITVPDQKTPRHDLVQTDGRWHRTGETNLFAGWMIDYYPGGARLSRSQISNGLLNGVSETWYTNGQMQVREHFKDGISDGLREKWHENGARLSQATIVEGKVTGAFRSWYDNGQLSEQINMKHGQPDGTAWAYYPSGFVKAETAVDDGKVLARQSWADGQRRQISGAANGPEDSKTKLTTTGL